MDWSKHQERKLTRYERFLSWLIAVLEAHSEKVGERRWNKQAQQTRRPW